MDGIKISLQHATHYNMSSSEDDYSDLSSDDSDEVEDVMEDATIEYSELATAAGRRQFIHRLTCGGLQGSDTNLEEASGSDYFVKEIGFNFDNSEQSLFLDTAARNEFSVHLNGVGEQVVLCDESDRTETPSCSSVTSPSVGAAVPNGELPAHLQILKPNCDDALQGSEQLLLLNTPQEKPVIINALQTTENLPKFKVVRMEPPETHPVIEPLHGTSSDPTVLDGKTCYEILSEVESLLEPSPSHSEFSPPAAPCSTSPGVVLESRHLSDSTNAPQDPSSSSSSAAKDDSLIDALQRSLAKKAAPEDSYETTSTDLSRESSLSSTCRQSLASHDQPREGDDNEKKELEISTSGKGKGKKKKKVAQTRRAHNSRAFKKVADQPSSERESSSDELEDQEWISNRPITRHFFNNLDKFCNRASRPRKSKPRGRPRKNAGSSKPAFLQPQPIPAVVQPLPPPLQPANPALNDPFPVALDLQGDVPTLAAGANAALEPYTDELFEEEELMRMFPSHLTQVIEEAGLNISDLTFNTSTAFDDIRCDESVLDPVDGNLMSFSELTASVAAASVVAAAQPVSESSSVVPVAVELQLPAIPCEKPTEVIKFTDETSTSPAQIEVPLADESQLPSKSESLGLINSDPVIVSEPMMKNCDIPLETKPHFPLKPELSPAQDESVSPSPPLPNIRPGSVVLAYMDASGNLVPVSSTGITMEEVQSAVAEELGSSYKNNPSPKSASEPTPSEAAACDVKPDISALEVASSAEDVEGNLFKEYEMKQNKDKVLVTPGPAVLTNTPAEEEINVKVEPLSINVKEEVFVNSSCSDTSDSSVDECQVKLPPSVSPSSSNGASDIALQPKKSVPVIKDENNSSLPTRIGTDRPVEGLATTLPVNDKAPLSPSTEGVICKIPDYLQTIFKEQKCEDSLPGQGNVDSDVKLAVKAGSEADHTEIGASDVQEKSCSTGTSSDSSDPSGSQKPRKKINVSEYFKRKHRVADAPKGITRSASVNQAKQDASASSNSISKTLPQIAKTRPEITNIKSMLSDDVPEYANAVAPQGGSENQVVASGITKSVAPIGAVNSKSKNVKVSTPKCVSGTKPKMVTDVPKKMPQPQAKAQNLPRESKDIRTIDVNHSKAPEIGNFKVKNLATVIKNSDKVPVVNRQISVPTDAEREAVTRVAKKVLSSFEPAHAQTSRGTAESERCTSPCSRSSSIGSLRGRKRDRSSSVVSSSYTSDSIDSRKSRRRHRHRSTSPSVSPIPLFHKKRNKKSHKRHKSHRKRRRQSSSSSSRSRSPSLGRRCRRRRSFSPARSRSRSLSSDSYRRKKRSGKRSRYNSRSRSRSFSPNTVYSVGCACGGGDPKFVGHLASCQHYSPDALYPTPEPPLRPSQQYYHPPQYPYQHPAQYPYHHPYYYDDFNAGPPQEYGGAYMYGRRNEADAFVYSRSGRPSSLPEPNLRAKQVEERLVVYVGRIKKGTEPEDLTERFKKFGSVIDASVHFRERGDNYGFVTFSNSEEANRAIENGNKGEELQYDLCFGGRRQFCRQQYKDLDALPPSGTLNQPPIDFDTLLKEMKSSRR